MYICEYYPLSHTMTQLGKEQNPWTEEEKNAIRELYPHISRTSVGGYRTQLEIRCPGRSWTAVKHMAISLGVSASGKKTLDLTDLERGYLAGITDGEGCITMSRSFKMRSGKKYYWTPHVAYVNTDEKLIAWLEQIFKRGWLQYYKRVKHNNAWQKTCYELVMAGSPSVTALLEAIVPCLVNKKVQAELLLKFTSSRIDTNNWDKYTVDPEHTAMQIRHLNRKGRVSSTFEDHQDKFYGDDASRALETEVSDLI